MDPQQIKGFLLADEGEMLARYAQKGAKSGQIVEIGAWCGRSSVYLALALKELAQKGLAPNAEERLLFSVDHHRGSEENQPGWAWFDEQVWDEAQGAIDTLPHFRKNIRSFDLEEKVVAMVGQSSAIGRAWGAPLGLLFLDGNHTMETALDDYRAWAGHVATGGYMAIHDVFPDPADGGRPPFEICRLAEKSGLFQRVDATGSLVVLQRC